jgi:hypothetical protein
VVGEGYQYVDCGPFNATCRYRYDFNQANMNIRYTEGGNLHTFCGQITDHKSVNLGDGCNPLFGTHCATFKKPTNFTAQSIAL